jgi:hypothetical protein
MAIDRRHRRVLIGAAVAAALLPAIALFPYPIPLRPYVHPARPTLQPSPVPAVASVYQRPLFAPVEAAADTPADAPALVGIAGRLNRDAVALVKLADGSARSLAVGDSVDGWRLESLAIDAAFFTRGRERVRVGMAAEAPVDPAPPQ